MTLTPRGIKTRGASLLSALVLVGVLAGFTIAIQSANVNNQALTATAATPTAAPSQSSIQSSAPKNCLEAINKALGKSSDGPAESTDKGKAGVVDACFGAHVNPGSTPSNNRSDYTCTGRKGTAYVYNGTMTVRTNSVFITPGTCLISICNDPPPGASGVSTPPPIPTHCSPAASYKGGVNGSASTGIGPGLPPGEVPATPPPPGSPSGSDQITGAFSNPVGCDQSGASAATCIPPGSYSTVQDWCNASQSDGGGKGSDVCTQAQTPDQSSLSCGSPGSDPAHCIPTGENPNPKPIGCDQPGASATTCIPPGGYTTVQDWCKGSGATSPVCSGAAPCGGPNCPTQPPPKQPPGGCTGPNCAGGCPGNPNCPAGGGQVPGGGGNTFGGGSGMGGLASLLSGLGKGLGGGAGSSAPQQPAQPCSTDQNIYAQQQQQYQQALQQYNYQLQQYNYQQQLNQYYGNTTVAPVPPTMPTACTPSTQSQCSLQPQQPDASTCTGGTWQPIRSGNCIVNWQCSTGQAQISCQPQLADVGMSIAISYACSAGTATGGGFTAGAQPSGSATTTVQNPPAGANTATYSLTCTNNGVTSSAQCSVQISKPTILLVANPKTVQSGDTSTIGWITTGMQSCTISSPNQADFNTRNSSNTSVNGTATTSPITGITEFDLHCQTAAGGTKDASVRVTTGTPGADGGSISISSDADGKTINHGDTAHITWQSSNEPSGAVVALWLIDARTNQATALIAGNQPLSGTYAWALPAAGSTCVANASNVCGSDLVASRQYAIEADVYTPNTAYVGDGPPPSNPVSPNYVDFADTATFTLGQ